MDVSENQEKGRGAGGGRDVGREVGRRGKACGWLGETLETMPLQSLCSWPPTAANSQ